jgi:hypothetical protein
MDVQLKVNMIMPGGRFVPYGAVIDRDEIPPNIRKERYYGAPGDVEPLHAPSEAEGQEDGGEADEPVEGEIAPPPPRVRPSPLRRGGNDEQ